jgi:hypothetical protein
MQSDAWLARREASRLPAISAVAAISAVTTTIATIVAAAASATTTAAVTTTMSAAVAAVSTTATTTTATTAATTLFLWAGFIDYQIAATKILPVQRVHRAVRFFVVGNFHEGKTT